MRALTPFLVWQADRFPQQRMFLRWAAHAQEKALMVQRLRKSFSHFQNTTLLAGWAQLSAGIDRARLESSATEQLKEWVALARGEAGIRNLREAIERDARCTFVAHPSFSVTEGAWPPLPN